MKRLRAALLDLGLPGEAPDPSLSLVTKRATSGVSAYVCSYSDAEFQIMLRELRYPPFRQGLR
jgi:hypothetical protein